MELLRDRGFVRAEHRTTDAPAQPIGAFVRGHPVKPGLQGTLVINPVCKSKQAQENILQ
jgi:hypothetical protein